MNLKQINDIMATQMEGGRRAMVASLFAAYIERLQLQDRRLRLKRLIASYFAVARCKEIDRGITLEYLSAGGKIRIVYPDGKEVTMPIFNDDEEYLASKLFDNYMTPTYTLKNSVMLAHAIAKLRRLHGFDYAFKMKMTANHLRQLRIYGLLYDYHIDPVHVWSIWLPGWNRNFQWMRSSHFPKAQNALGIMRGYVEE